MKQTSEQESITKIVQVIQEVQVTSSLYLREYTEEYDHHQHRLSGTGTQETPVRRQAHGAVQPILSHLLLAIIFVHDLQARHKTIL